MWTVAGILLGILVLSSLLGFHLGPHSHAVAALAGVLAAGWLLGMLLTGNTEPLVWSLLSADVVVSAGVATAAWKGLQAERVAERHQLRARLVGSEGVALTDLDPDGIVRARGETWSATSLNGRLVKGTRVQVVESQGVRIGVWGEGVLNESAEGPPVSFRLDDGDGAGARPEERRSGSR